MKRGHWTEGEIEQVIQLKEGGLCWREIGKALDRKQNSCSSCYFNHLNRNNIAEDTSCVRWTPEEDKTLLSMEEQGCLWDDISNTLHRNIRSCRSRFNYLHRLKQNEKAERGKQYDN